MSSKNYFANEKLEELTKSLQPSKRTFDEKIYKFKTPFLSKVVSRLHVYDQKIFDFLYNVSETEFVVTKKNIIGTTIRNFLGIRLPDEPQIVKTEEGAEVNRWVDILKKVEKRSPRKDADPQRVTTLPYNSAEKAKAKWLDLEQQAFAEIESKRETRIVDSKDN